MTHIQDEGHYQEMMNSQAQAEMEAQMQQMEGEAKSEAEYVKELMVRELGESQIKEPETLIDWDAMEKTTGGGLSFGEKLVGYTFNPSGDAKVQRAKELCSQLADLIKDDYMSKESSTMGSRLFNHAIGEILNAQMNAVKVLTFKD